MILIHGHTAYIWWRFQIKPDSKTHVLHHQAILPPLDNCQRPLKVILFLKCFKDQYKYSFLEHTGEKIMAHMKNDNFHIVIHKIFLAHSLFIKSEFPI